MPTYEGRVLRIYELPIIVEAADQEEALRKIEEVYHGMRDGYDGAQDIFRDMELPSPLWPIGEVEESEVGSITREGNMVQWTSWAI
jgi:hypothetical protein